MHAETAVGEIVLDRRAVKRTPIHVEVSCQVESPFTATTRDLTPRGLFVQTPTRPTLHTSLELCIALPGLSAPLEVTGRVVRRSQPGCALEPDGFAVEFTGLDDGARDALIEFVEEMRVTQVALGA